MLPRHVRPVKALSSTRSNKVYRFCGMVEPQIKRLPPVKGVQLGLGTEATGLQALWDWHVNVGFHGAFLVG